MQQPYQRKCPILVGREMILKIVQRCYQKVGLVLGWGRRYFTELFYESGFKTKLHHPAYNVGS
jgi:hypothetical protein